MSTPSGLALYTRLVGAFTQILVRLWSKQRRDLRHFNAWGLAPRPWVPHTSVVPQSCLPYGRVVTLSLTVSYLDRFEFNT